MSRARIGFIGLGMIGKAHLKVAMASDAVLPVAAADPSEAAGAHARAHNLSFHDDYRVMLDKEKLDGVIVGSPNALHVPMGLACIERGIPVLIEKPIAEDVAGAGALCEAAEAKGVPVLVGHHRRHSAPVRRARKAIQEGMIGRPTIATVMYTQLKPESYFSLAWRKEPKSGGPILINLIHEIDLARFVFGEIVSLQAMTSTAIRGFPVEDTAAVVLRFANGALGTISLSDTAATPFTWDLASGEFDLMTEMTGKLKRPRAHSHVFAGTQGSITLPTLDYYSYSGKTEPGWLSDMEQSTLAAMPVNAYVEQMAHFARVCRREEAPVVSGRDGLRTLEATLAVKQSAATGRAVELVA